MADGIPTQVISPELSRYSWPQMAHLITLVEHPILSTSCFALLPKMAKLLFCSVSNSSILQYNKMCVIVILTQNWWSDLDLHLLKLMLGNTHPYLKALMAKYELSHWIPALLSIPIKTKPYNRLSEQGIFSNRCQPNKQTPLPNSIQYPQGLTDKQLGSV